MSCAKEGWGSREDWEARSRSRTECPSLAGMWVGCGEQNWEGVGGSLPPPGGMAPPSTPNLPPSLCCWRWALLLATSSTPWPRDPSVGISEGHPSEDKPPLLALGLLGKGSATITGTGGSRSFLEEHREGLRGANVRPSAQGVCGGATRFGASCAIGEGG